MADQDQQMIVDQSEIAISTKRHEEQKVEEYSESEPNKNGFFADTNNTSACSVQVALRVRPLIGREMNEAHKICVQCFPRDKQIMIGQDRYFNYDAIYDMDSEQEQLFEDCVKNLVLGCFSGFNATVLAYGQTGSGKTHTMGSGYTIGIKDEDLGIIPRVIRFLFSEIDKRKSRADFIIKCSFLEIYNEELHDLLETNGIGNAPVKKDVQIREEKNGQISLYGLKEETVSCYEELAACLDKGSNSRSVSSTLMNSQSSRSHGIFTISIEQHAIEELGQGLEGNENSGAGGQSQQQSGIDEFMVAKFHFVDLAGSERAKKTGASGATLKEGININKGLLALGNVISALTEEKTKGGHVPYRDSKLTRILQDSLGGNSRTTMIACVSPAQSNMEETLNTLKYAARARNIKNKPTINRDPTSLLIATLRQQVYDLQKELISARKTMLSNNLEFESTIQLPDEAQMNQNLQSIQKFGATGSSEQARPTSDFGLSGKEIQKFEQEIKDLKIDKSQKAKQITSLEQQLKDTKQQHDQQLLEVFQVRKERDIFRFQLEQISSILERKNLMEEVKNEMLKMHKSQQQDNQDMEVDQDHSTEGQQLKTSSQEGYDLFDTMMKKGPTILEDYQKQVEELNKQLSEKTQVCSQLQSDCQVLIKSADSDNKMLESKESEIERLKRTVAKLQKENAEVKNDIRKAGKPQMSQQAQGKQVVGQQASRRATIAAASSFKRQNTISGSSRLTTVLPIDQLESGADELQKELDNDFEQFNKKFIDNLSSSLSTMFVDNSKRRMTHIQPSQKQSLIQGPITGRSTLGNQNQAELDQINEENSQSLIKDSESEKHESAQGQHFVNIGDSSGSENEMMDDFEAQMEEQFSHIEKLSESINSNDQTTGDIKQIQDELIQEDQQIKEQDQQQKKEIEVKKQEINDIEDSLKSKEQLLDIVKQSQQELQQHLIKAMENKYHNKIMTLMNDIQVLETEKQDQVNKASTQQAKSKAEEQYKKKIKDQELKLKELQQKEKETMTIQKNVNKQKSKINQLQQDIDKIKIQKVSLQKKIKDENDKYAKWRKERANEILQIKKANIKKDKEIDKLKRENKRKDLLAKRKIEEISLLQKQQVQMKKVKTNATKQRQQKQAVSIDQLKEWIQSNTVVMLKYKQLTQDLILEERNNVAIEKSIREEQDSLGKLSVKQEKLLQEKNKIEQINEEEQDQEQKYQIDEEMGQIVQEKKVINNNIESLEEKQQFLSIRISQLNAELIQLNPDQISKLDFLNEIQSVEGARTILSAFFTTLLEANVEKSQLEQLVLSHEATIETISKEMEQIMTLQKSSEASYQKSLEELKDINRQKEAQILTLIMESAGVDFETLQKDQLGQYNIDEVIREVQAKVAQLKNQQPELSKKDSVNDNIRKAGVAKAQIKQNNQDIYQQTKAALSKQLVEYEHKVKDITKKNENLKHRYEQAQYDKEQYKRQVDNFKYQIKTMETMQNTNAGKHNQKEIDSPRKGAQGGSQDLRINPSKIQTLQEKRDELKKKKKLQHLNGSVGNMDDITGLNLQKVNHNQSDNVQNEKRNSNPQIVIDQEVDNENPFESNASIDQSNQPDVFSRLQQNAKGRTSNTKRNLLTSQNFLNFNSRNSRVDQSRSTANSRMGSNNRLGTGQGNALNSSRQINDAQSQNIQFTEQYEDNHRWKCRMSKAQAHQSQIFQVASADNHLYSTSNKSFKIWNLETMHCISDISAHNGYIKCLKVWADKKLLLTASDKSIVLWDMISLTKVGHLEGHKNEIKSLAISTDGNMLFSAGKGSSQGGALLIWDIRKGAQPLLEKENNQDIFSMITTDSTLFFGCRDHHIYPMQLDTFDVQSRIAPPHFDVVTSLVNLQGSLVSASRDKNIRAWSLDAYEETMQLNQSNQDIMNAHQEAINVLETDHDLQEMYSGSKDGIIKVWKKKEDSFIQCTAKLNGGAQCINSISRIDKQFGKMFVSAGQDKALRIWKMNDQEEGFDDDDNWSSSSGKDINQYLQEDVTQAQGNNIDQEMGHSQVQFQAQDLSQKLMQQSQMQQMQNMGQGNIDYDQNQQIHQQHQSMMQKSMNISQIEHKGSAHDQSEDLMQMNTYISKYNSGNQAQQLHPSSTHQTQHRLNQLVNAIPSLTQQQDQQNQLPQTNLVVKSHKKPTSLSSTKKH